MIACKCFIIISELQRLRKLQAQLIQYWHMVHVYTEQARGRRQTAGEVPECPTSLNSCELLLVADDLFHMHIGKQNPANTVRIMVSRLCKHIFFLPELSGILISVT